VRLDVLTSCPCLREWQQDHFVRYSVIRLLLSLVFLHGLLGNELYHNFHTTIYIQLAPNISCVLG
jgi:hypothetical protein